MKDYDLLVSDKPKKENNIFEILDVDFSDVANLPISLLGLSPEIQKALNSKSKIKDGKVYPFFETLGELVNFGYNNLSYFFDEKFLTYVSADRLQEVEEKLAEFALKLKYTNFSVFEIQLSSLNISDDAKLWARKKDHETLGDIYMLGSTKLNKMANSPKGTSRQQVGKEMLELLQTYGISAESVKLSSHLSTQDGILTKKSKLKHSFPKILQNVKTITQKAEEEKKRKEEQKNNPETSNAPVLENQVAETIKPTRLKQNSEAKNKPTKHTKFISTPDPDQIKMYAFQSQSQIPEWLKKKQAEEEKINLQKELARKQAEAEAEKKREAERAALAEKEAQERRKKEELAKQRLLEDQNIAKERGITVEQLREERRKIAQSKDSLLNIKPLFFSATAPKEPVKIKEESEDEIVAKQVIKNIATASNTKKESQTDNSKPEKRLTKENNNNINSEQRQKVAESVQAGYARFKSQSEKKAQEEANAKRLNEKESKVAAKESRFAEKEAKAAAKVAARLANEAKKQAIIAARLAERQAKEKQKAKLLAERQAKKQAIEARKAAEEQKKKQLEAEAAEKGITIEELKKQKFSEAVKAGWKRYKENNPKTELTKAEKRHAEAFEKKVAKQQQLEAEAKSRGITVEQLKIENRKEYNRVFALKRYYELKNSQTTISKRAEKQQQLEAEAAEKGITVEELKKQKRAEIVSNAAKLRWEKFHAEHPEKTKEGKRALKQKQLEEEAAEKGITVEQLKAIKLKEKRAVYNRNYSARKKQEKAAELGLTVEELDKINHDKEVRRIEIKNRQEEFEKRKAERDAKKAKLLAEREAERERKSKERAARDAERQAAKLAAKEAKKQQLEAEAAALGITVEELKKIKKAEIVGIAAKLRWEKFRAEHPEKTKEGKRALKQKQLEEKAAALGMTVEEMKLKQKQAEAAAAREKRSEKTKARRLEKQAEYKRIAAERGITVAEVIEEIRIQRVKETNQRRMEKYYRDHPEKLAEKQKRDAKKARNIAEAKARGITVAEVALENRKKGQAAYRQRLKEQKQAEAEAKQKELETEAAKLGITAAELKELKRREKIRIAGIKRFEKLRQENPELYNKKMLEKQKDEEEAAAKGITVEELQKQRKRQNVLDGVSRRVENYYKQHPEALENRRKKEQTVINRQKREERRLEAQKQMEVDMAEAAALGISYEEFKKQRASRLKSEATKRRWANYYAANPNKIKTEKPKRISVKAQKLAQKQKALEIEATEKGITVEQLKYEKRKEKNREAALRYYDKKYNISSEERAKREKKREERLAKKAETKKQLEIDTAKANALGISLNEYKKIKNKEIRIKTAERARQARMLKIAEHNKKIEEEEAKRKENFVTLSESQAETLINMKGYEFKALSTKIFNIFGIGKRMSATLEDMAISKNIITVGDLMLFNIYRIKSYHNNKHVTNLNDINKINDVLAYYNLRIGGTRYMIKNRKVVRNAKFKGEPLDVEAILASLKLDAKNRPNAPSANPDILVPLQTNNVNSTKNSSNFQFANTGFGGGAVRLKPVHSNRLTNTSIAEAQNNAPKVISDADIKNAENRLSWLKERLKQKGAAAALDVAVSFFNEDSAEFKVISKMLDEYLMQITYSAIMSNSQEKDANAITQMVLNEKQLFEKIVDAKRNGMLVSEIKLNLNGGGNSGGGSDKKFHHGEFGWAKRGMRVHKFNINKKSNELGDKLEFNEYYFD